MYLKAFTLMLDDETHNRNNFNSITTFQNSCWFLQKT
jgi:hypothetical protein